MDKLFFNPAKERLKRGEQLSAGWIQMASPLAAEIMAQAGFDLLVIDCEHAPIDPINLIQLLQAVNGYESTPMVRAPWNDLVSIKRLLDCGAMGVHIPYVNTAEEALTAVRACKYPPAGNRGIAGSPRAAGFGCNRGEYLNRANDQILIMIAIETPEALENLDAMMDVPGVDGIFIGPMDLSTTLGYFGNPQHPEAQRIIRETEKRVLERGDKLLGTTAGSAEAAKELYERGYSYVIFGGDSANLRASASKMITSFKGYMEL